MLINKLEKLTVKLKQKLIKTVNRRKKLASRV